jgi:hypothetical protein
VAVEARLHYDRVLKKVGLDAFYLMNIRAKKKIRKAKLSLTNFESGFVPLGSVYGLNEKGENRPKLKLGRDSLDHGGHINSDTRDINNSSLDWDISQQLPTASLSPLQSADWIKNLSRKITSSQMGQRVDDRDMEIDRERSDERNGVEGKDLGIDVESKRGESRGRNNGKLYHLKIVSRMTSPDTQHPRYQPSPIPYSPLGMSPIPIRMSPNNYCSNYNNDDTDIDGSAARRECLFQSSQKSYPLPLPYPHTPLKSYDSFDPSLFTVTSLVESALTRRSLANPSPSLAENSNISLKIQMQCKKRSKSNNIPLRIRFASARDGVKARALEAKGKDDSNPNNTVPNIITATVTYFYNPNLKTPISLI